MTFNVQTFVPINALRIIYWYYCFIYSHLQYCISYGTDCNSVLQPLNTVRNNLLRALTFIHVKCHTTPLYKEMLFFIVKDTYQLELSNLMHKFDNNTFLPQLYNELLSKDYSNSLSLD